MAELSIIIPFCNEWPQVAFTIRDIAEELRDRVDFEVIAIDNHTPEVTKQGFPPDKGHVNLKSMAEKNPWLKVVPYSAKLSHWQSKNLGVSLATGKFLWFCDAHCMIRRDSLYDMFLYYSEFHENLNGSLHLPLTYHVLETKRLHYRVYNLDDPKRLHYKFKKYRPNGSNHTRVPCMSTCGMMITRDLYDLVGGWPKELGIYGGGENFINFTLGVLGKNVNLFNHGLLHHHGNDRDYRWNEPDYIRNRTIAVYMYGGYDMAYEYAMSYTPQGGSGCYPKHTLFSIFSSVADRCDEHRKLIEGRQVMRISEWSDMIKKEAQAGL